MSGKLHIWGEQLVKDTELRRTEKDEEKTSFFFPQEQ